MCVCVVVVAFFVSFFHYLHQLKPYKVLISKTKLIEILNNEHIKMLKLLSDLGGYGLGPYAKYHKIVALIFFSFSMGCQNEEINKQKIVQCHGWLKGIKVAKEIGNYLYQAMREDIYLPFVQNNEN